MPKVAQCQCGSLRASVEGEHEAVVACSCLGCQRRTGSVLGVGAYFPRDRVSITGEAREYVRTADSGYQLRSFFCPTCGTSVYWFSERDPNRLGIAVGAFGDSDFPAPQRSVFDARKHRWVQFSPDIPGFVGGRDSRRTR